MDLALQCAPDHPWVTEHPEWFTTRADGSIAYAENPPKKYQDIYPLNFDNDPEGIRAEVLRVVLHWVGEGIRIFRVDNPHTKPFDFWHWLIAEVKKVDPDVLFLAEAFTRPAIMHGLGQGRLHPVVHLLHLAHVARRRCGRTARSWSPRPTTCDRTSGRTRPDILHESLQHGGPPMFKIRAVLAALLSPSWGMYAGYELFEHVARPGAEEYLDNEKYELRPRDWAGARGAGPLAGAVHRPAQRGPPGQPGPAPAAQPALPRDRQPGAALLVQARPGDRQHGDRGLLVRLAQRAVGQHHAGHAGARASTGTSGSPCATS